MNHSVAVLGRLVFLRSPKNEELCIYIEGRNWETLLSWLRFILAQDLKNHIYRAQLQIPQQTTASFRPPVGRS